MGQNFITRRNKKADEEPQISDDEDTTERLYCHGLYSESIERITCQICGKWAHCGFAGVEDNDDEAVHICPVCEDEED
ncbi:hypothetical protein WA026_004040 [Henosepilachna vigintioctopunctata]|uniref:Uncharacterized protein n=1 Tax=Henosepilachna vigintioctopunctata TaxID=420089 RepID=A0AAW1U6D1_9CUCU